MNSTTVRGGGSLQATSPAATRATVVQPGIEDFIAVMVLQAPGRATCRRAVKSLTPVATLVLRGTSSQNRVPMKLVGPLILAASWLVAAPAAASTSSVGTPAGLSEGAAAISAGDYHRGVALTLQGLAEIPGSRDRAAALSNLCAGLVGLRDYPEALRRCDQSLALNDTNWRTWNNRAAALLGLGLVRRAITDAERGLAINPESETLQLTLRIARSRLEDRRRLRRGPVERIVSPLRRPASESAVPPDRRAQA